MQIFQDVISGESSEGFEEDKVQAIRQLSEGKVATRSLVLAALYAPNPRVVAHPAMITRQSRMEDKSLWAAFALYQRHRALQRGRAFWPPCMVCARQTGCWCDHCEMPMCTSCDGTAVCPVCFPAHRDAETKAAYERALSTARALDLANAARAAARRRQN